MGESSEKRCVICGLDCADAPRIRDRSGRYAHRACAERASATKAAAAIAAPEPDAMSALLADLPVEATIQPQGLTALCPHCHARVASDDVLCTACGTNILTGQRPKMPKPPKTQKETKPEKTTRSRASSGSGAGFGKLIAATSGAGAVVTIAWIAIAFNAGIPLAFGAALVGAACGATAMFISGGATGFAPAGAAMLATVIAISIGNGATGHLSDRDEAGIITVADDGTYTNGLTSADISEHDALQFLVDDIAEERLAAGQRIHWPQPGMTLDRAIWPDDYPRQLRTATLERWNGMSESDREAYKAECADRINAWAVEQQAMEEDDRYRQRAGGAIVGRSMRAARLSSVGVRSGRGGRVRSGAAVGGLISIAVVASANGGGSKIGMARAHEYFFGLVALLAAFTLANVSRD